MWKENAKKDIQKEFKKSNRFFRAVSKMPFMKIWSQISIILILATLTGLAFKFKGKWEWLKTIFMPFSIVAGILVGIMILYLLFTSIVMLSRWNFVKKIDRKKIMNEALKEETVKGNLENYQSNFYQPIIWKFDWPIKQNQITIVNGKKIMTIKNFTFWSYWYKLIKTITKATVTFAWLTKKFYKKQKQNAKGAQGIKMIVELGENKFDKKIVVKRKRWFNKKQNFSDVKGFSSKFRVTGNLEYAKTVLTKAKIEKMMEIYKNTKAIPKMKMDGDKILFKTKINTKVYKSKSDKLIAGITIFKKFNKPENNIISSVEKDIAYLNWFTKYVNLVA